MLTEINLAEFGLFGVFNCRGAIKSERRSGQQLLFLFGERHSVKPYIRENLLNAVDLDKLEAVSFVGVESHTLEDLHDPCLKKEFDELSHIHGPDAEKVVDDMMRKMADGNFFFWKILRLLRPKLRIESVEDSTLKDRVSALQAQYMSRVDAIRCCLEKSDLFECGAQNRESKIQEKTNLQWELEFAEEGIQRERESKFIENLKAHWEEFRPKKAAILNAGTSHQYRIARQLPESWSSFHIEQP